MGFFNRSPRKASLRESCGHCQDCRWWQGQASGSTDRISLGLCMHAEIVHFNLEVSGESGCNRFEPIPAMAGAEAEALPILAPTFA